MAGEYDTKTLQAHFDVTNRRLDWIEEQLKLIAQQSGVAYATYAESLNVPDEVVASAAPLHRTGAASSSPQLSVRFPGQGRACRFNAILSRNNGRPTDVTCLVEGNGFIPYRPVHLTYDVSIPMLPVAPTDQSARVANRPVLTPLPHVRCLMRLPRSCRVIVPNAHGHFGPVWMRFIYLLGERNQYFEIRAYGGPHDQATFTLPYQIVNE
jgi:hypothetical protein